MTRKMIVPLIFGILGAAILCALGLWQVQRLEWKQAILQDLEAKLAAPAIELPENPEPESNNYVAVSVAGTLLGPELHVLTSRKSDGPGFRVIRAMETLDKRRVLIDLGFVKEADKDAARPDIAALITGNMILPRETDSFTPPPNLNKNIWFARDTTTMAEALNTEPLMVVVRNAEPTLHADPLPVTVNVPNDHLEYAITWFSLMIVWIGMTVFYLWRIKRA